MVEIRNHNFGWHQFPEVLPFSFSSTPPLSSVTKARHNLLTGIMELLIINVIFSSFPKIYSELSSAGGTRHISQSNLPQKLPVSFRWTGVKRRRQRLILQAEIIPGILPAHCIHVLHVLLEPLWIPLLRQRSWYPTRTLLSCDVCKHTMHYTVFYPCLHSARLTKRSSVCYNITFIVCVFFLIRFLISWSKRFRFYEKSMDLFCWRSTRVMVDHWILEAKCDSFGN